MVFASIEITFKHFNVKHVWREISQILTKSLKKVTKTSQHRESRWSLIKSLLGGLGVVARGWGLLCRWKGCMLPSLAAALIYMEFFGRFEMTFPYLPFPPPFHTTRPGWLHQTVTFRLMWCGNDKPGDRKFSVLPSSLSSNLYFL